MMDVDILLRLIVAHLLVDFGLQTNKTVRKKKEKNIFSHAVHSLMQAIVAYIVVGSWHLWIIIPIIFITHLSIDFWKTTQKEKLSSFTIDQILHLSVIVLLWLCLTNQFRSFAEACCNIMKHNQIWAVLICYLIILKPTSLFLGLFTKRWRTDSAISESLKNAGQWIGYLERFLILTFILINEMSAIGFLLAAKSIFRFGELNKSKEIKTTEYVLIGTLASFSIAIFIGLILTRFCL